MERAELPEVAEIREVFRVILGLQSAVPATVPRGKARVKMNEQFVSSFYHLGYECEDNDFCLQFE